MSPLELAARASADPLVRYALLGAAVLAVASLGGGWLRGDVRALARPATWAALGAAVIAATALAAAGDRIGGVLDGGWPLEGLRRLPLHLLALGYGPTVGVLAGLAFAAVETGQLGPSGAGAVLVLELSAIGWIAIAPSPRRRRLAAPLAVLTGWALATATLGLAGRAADGVPPSLTALIVEEGAVPIGVLASASVVTLPTPGWWRRAVPGAAPGVTGVRVDDGRRVLHPLIRRRRRARRRAPLQPARTPGRLPPRARARGRLTEPVVPSAMTGERHTDRRAASGGAEPDS